MGKKEMMSGNCRVDNAKVKGRNGKWRQGGWGGVLFWDDREINSRWQNFLKVNILYMSYTVG